MAQILCNMPTGLYLTWPQAPSPSLAGIWPQAADPFLTLNGANVGQNGQSGPDGQGIGYALNTINSLLWANARASGSSGGGVGALITSLINSGQIIVLQA